MQRIDLLPSDCFVSWTGADRKIKEVVVSFLSRKGLSVIESDEHCAGDYRLWSKEAVASCSIMVVVLTKNTESSTYVPLEIDALKELDDFQNRVVPLSVSDELYQTKSFGLNEFASAVFFQDGLTQNVLDSLYNKVASLILNRSYLRYRESIKPSFEKMIPLWSGIEEKKRFPYSFSDFFIPRELAETTEDDSSSSRNIIDGIESLFDGETISFLYGNAGTGKTQYVSNITNSVDNSYLPFLIKCEDTLHHFDSTLFDYLFETFKLWLGDTIPYSKLHFTRLLDTKKILLIFDSFDEVYTDTNKEKLISWIEKFYLSRSEKIVLIFTSRNKKDADRLVFGNKTPRSFKLIEFDAVKTEKLCKKVFDLLGEANSISIFLSELQKLNHEIRTNPLFIIQLAIIFHHNRELPSTKFDIIDTITDIFFSSEKNKIIFDDDLIKSIPMLLNQFAKERFDLLIRGRAAKTEQIFCKILKAHYFDYNSKAEEVLQYLHNRCIFVNGDFYHRLFLEFFAASSYYDIIFDDYGYLEDINTFESLFSRHGDENWTNLLYFLLVRADSLSDEGISELLKPIRDDLDLLGYDLLFDASLDMKNHAGLVQELLVEDILIKSSNGVFPPYGPFFYYIPKYEFYLAAIMAAFRLKGNVNAAALVRDVCYIFGKFDLVSQLVDDSIGEDIYSSIQPNLRGIRQKLCEIFYSKTNEQHTDKSDVYPRCFNPTECSINNNACGFFGRASAAFVDELSLYEHCCYPEMDGEYIGIISDSYDLGTIQNRFHGKTAKRVTGLFLSPTSYMEMGFIPIYQKSIRTLYIPENITGFAQNWDKRFNLSRSVIVWENNILYIDPEKSCLSLPDGIICLQASFFNDYHSFKTIILPNSVQDIAKQTFKNFKDLVRVEYKNSSVKRIKEATFENCTKLQEVIIPEGLTEIADKAFSGCSNLQRVIIPNTVKRIGSKAFENCSELTEIHISSKVTTIGYGAFRGCKKLASICLPASLTSLERAAFQDCEMLEEIAIPNKITNISDSLFEGCRKLNKVILHDSIVEIGNSSFENCKAIKAVDLPRGIRVIRSRAFRNCYELGSITLPPNLCIIQEKTFQNCKALRNVVFPTELKEITKSAFSGCKSLKTIILPKTLHRVGNYAFSYCKKLQMISFLSKDVLFGKKILVGSGKNLVVVLPKQLRLIRDELLFNCYGLKEVSINSFVEEIGKKAFWGCNNLKSIRLPVSVKSIAASAFEDCSDLVTVEMSDSINSIGAAAFKRCTSLIDIHLPSSINSISDELFCSCHRLRKIKIPPAVERIGESAFDGCYELDSVQIPNAVKRIDSKAFSFCRKLFSVGMTDSVNYIGKAAFSYCESLVDMSLSRSIDNISDDLFAHCSSLKEIFIHTSVSVIGHRAFYHCSNLHNVRGLKGVIEIQSNAFKDCIALQEIILPEGGCSIANTSFEGCVNLPSIIINYIEQYRVKSARLGFVAGLPKETTPWINRMRLKKLQFMDFSSIENLEIKPFPFIQVSVNDSAFCEVIHKLDDYFHSPGFLEYSLLSSFSKKPELIEQKKTCDSFVTIENGTKVIKAYEFCNCCQLQEVVFETTALTEIEEFAFCKCTRLNRLTIPSTVGVIRQFAFYGCESLKELFLPHSLHTIEQHAFSKCTGLERIIVSGNFSWEELESIFGPSLNKEIVSFYY